MPSSTIQRTAAESAAVAVDRLELSQRSSRAELMVQCSEVLDRVRRRRR